MIKKIICFIWGHKHTAKMFTGNTYSTTNVLGMPISVSLCTLKCFKNCIRCNAPIKKER